MNEKKNVAVLCETKAIFSDGWTARGKTASRKARTVKQISATGRRKVRLLIWISISCKLCIFFEQSESTFWNVARHGNAKMSTTNTFGPARQRKICRKGETWDNEKVPTAKIEYYVVRPRLGVVYNIQILKRESIFNQRLSCRTVLAFSYKFFDGSVARSPNMVEFIEICKLPCVRTCKMRHFRCWNSQRISSDRSRIVFDAGDLNNKSNLSYMSKVQKGESLASVSLIWRLIFLAFIFIRFLCQIVFAVGFFLQKRRLEMVVW